MLLLSEVGKTVEEDQAFYVIVLVVIAIIAVVGEVKFSFGYVDFKVAFILQVEIGTRQLHIWIQIPEESCELKLKMLETLAKQIEIELMGTNEIT